MYANVKSTSHKVNIIEETNINAAMDRKIKSGLCRCFPNDAKNFSQTRAWHGSFPAFSVIVEDQGIVLAHVGIVDRVIKVANTGLRVGGLQNVFVLESCRGKGLFDNIMVTAMKESGRLGFDAGLLYCVPALEKVYARCGWKLLPENKIIRINEDGKKLALPEKNIAMFYPLKINEFPAGTIYLQGNDW